jgi:hypothetical protein
MSAVGLLRVKKGNAQEKYECLASHRFQPRLKFRTAGNDGARRPGTILLLLIAADGGNAAILQADGDRPLRRDVIRQHLARPVIEPIDRAVLLGLPSAATTSSRDRPSFTVFTAVGYIQLPEYPSGMAVKLWDVVACNMESAYLLGGTGIVLAICGMMNTSSRQIIRD